MKFSDMAYARPDMRALAEKLGESAAGVPACRSGAELLALFQGAQAMVDEAETMSTIASIRHTVDTRDEFYSAENDYFDEQGPVLADKVLSLYRALLASPYRGALSCAYGEIFTQKLETAVKSSDERLVSLQQEENALTTLYEKLYASARIPFDGRELTVAQLGPYKQSALRETRRAAYEAEGSFFEANREEFDGIYSRLVRNRTQQARQLGYNSFTPLGDIRMERLGYTREDVKALRQAVAQHIVPLVLRAKQAQARRIGVADFMFWDDPLLFPGGNPAPKGTPDELLEAGRQMYRSLSPETAAFIDFMMEGELFDVLAKPGKAPGGYCTYIPGAKSPFIFSNFNGTSADVDVLTHEAGHAFAAYLAAAKKLPSVLRNPGLESCEIHSMAMEFLTSPFHSLFFKDDTEKYALYHAEDAMSFLPYGCQVDEFQEAVYDNPGMSGEERCALWLRLEGKYRPWLSFGSLPFYARGGGWQRQLHIYVHPFYYIDYVLASLVALQFFAAHRQNAQDAWQRYLALAEKAGSETYVGLVRAAGFEVPFDAETVRKVGEDTFAWMNAQNLY